MIAPERRYHTSCRSSFENPIPKYPSGERRPSSVKVTAFNMEMEDDFVLYAVKQFYEATEKLGDAAYSSDVA